MIGKLKGKGDRYPKTKNAFGEICDQHKAIFKIHFIKSRNATQYARLFHTSNEKSISTTLPIKTSNRIK